MQENIGKKNFPAKNFPGEEFSGEELSGEELSGEEFSGEELSGNRQNAINLSSLKSENPKKRDIGWNSLKKGNLKIMFLPKF
jgi:uncharacterized protein YjbI with pentapeptide repeats